MGSNSYKHIVVKIVNIVKKERAIQELNATLPYAFDDHQDSLDLDSLSKFKL